MKIFKKKYVEDIRNQNQVIYEKIIEIKEILFDKSKKDFTFTLLDEKSKLEKTLSSETTKKEILEKNYKTLEEKTIEITKIYDSQVFTLQKEIMELKTKAKIYSNSVGGLRKQNNSLSKKVDQQTIYIKILSEELKKYTRRIPTLKQLFDYEHTRKSPFLKEK